MAKPLASTADAEEKAETLEVQAEGVYALTAGADSNVGAIEGEDFLVAVEARNTAGRQRLARETSRGCQQACSISRLHTILRFAPPAHRSSAMTPFMAPGNTVRIEMFGNGGQSISGAIEST